MDIAGLSKLTAESLVLVVSVLGFMVSALVYLIIMCSKFLSPTSPLVLRPKNTKLPLIVWVSTFLWYVFIIFPLKCFDVAAGAH